MHCIEGTNNVGQTVHIKATLNRFRATFLNPPPYGLIGCLCSEITHARESSWTDSEVLQACLPLPLNVPLSELSNFVELHYLLVLLNISLFDHKNFVTIFLGLK